MEAWWSLVFVCSVIRAISSRDHDVISGNVLTHRDVTSGNQTRSNNVTFGNDTRGCYVESDGCSVPGDFPAPYKETFTPACNKHDVCYSCGQHNKWYRSTCDDAFLKDMLALCHNDPSSKRFNVINILMGIYESVFKNGCKDAADMYYAAVKNFAGNHYPVRSPNWCRDPCVLDYGHPGKVVTETKWTNTTCSQE